MKVDLKQNGMPKMLAKRIAEDIDRWAIKEYDDGHRSHLGASLIGDECRRKLQLVFRWVKHEEFSGRMLRLFQRGHREEHIFTEYLRGIGCTVYPFYDDELIERLGLTGKHNIGASEPDSANKGARQFRVTGANGHFGGSLDGIVFLPPEYGYDKPLLLEYKTNSTGAGFNKLREKGVSIAKPQHHTQTNVYGSAYELEFVLYLNVNKNDDEIYIEIMPLNDTFGQQQFEKAEHIIMAEEPLPPISKSPNQMPCSYCNFKGICHSKELPEKNCRSCKNAVPIEGGKWGCRQWNAVIPNKQAILEGCGNWVPFING
ncbi:TPA: hypothetical protein NNP44_004630 [Salmonella enterica]|uniref:Putative exonuclease n=1 Tax=Acinetobacter phage Ab_SZ3 TaxID=2781361 RepID=A0A873WKP3_9CAUD|nr:putative exonuclease [Acinetobacter phage Ab_SZ3]WUU86595.1 Cas4-domain exonuclease [Acinetobacter phage vB_AbaSi_W9]HCH8285066.1 hypothetical protein [Salmonella enterica]HCH8780797.1 hypothetical protein [Salmonella enterica]